MNMGRCPYKKLVGVSKGTTKLISIPWRGVLSRLGFSKREPLYGRWIVKDNTLILEIKREKEILDNEEYNWRESKW